MADAFTAHDAELGADIIYDVPPRVVAPDNAPLLFVAPSTIGQVVEHLDTHPVQVRVRFQYRNGTGGFSWSDPLTVLPGQLCKLREAP